MTNKKKRMADGMSASHEQKVESDIKTAYVLALDVGTTALKSKIYTETGQIHHTSSRPMQFLHSKPGYTEIDEDQLWDQVVSVIRDVLTGGNLSAADITCMGITTQRNTFITWDSESGKPFHHFITWQDLRASDYNYEWNSSLVMHLLRKGSRLLYWITRQKRFLAASVLVFRSAQVTLRLLYEIDHNDRLKQRIADKKVLFGTIETWLLWKLTEGKSYATDYSCASSTGLYDPFQMEWSTVVSRVVGLPLNILPPVQDTSGMFGRCSPSIFGAAIPITAMAADQQASMFGHCLFDVGDIKITMGTGTFIDCNTGSKPIGSVAGLFPLVGWKIGDDVTYIAEGLATDTGLCIEWAKSIGLFDSVEQLAAAATSVPDTDGVCFVPAFNGLQAPINDDYAAATLIGIRASTSKAHIIRALLESLAYRVRLLYDTELEENSTPLSPEFRCDGGVTKNEFIMQMISDLTNHTLQVSEDSDVTTRGIAFLAGLGAGVWTRNQLYKLRSTSTTFKPSSKGSEKLDSGLKRWKQAVSRARSWYNRSDIKI